MYKLLAKTLLIVALVLAVLMPGTTLAIEVTGLYQVEVPVEDQTPKTRWGAIVKGFKEVLIRKSGSGRVLTTDEVKQALRKVTAYVQRFQYSATTDEDAESPFVLQLDFEPRLIDELIQQAGMPIWGSNRPVTILWLAAEQEFQRQMVKEDATKDSLSQLLMQNSKRRGIPVILPLMDLEDELNVSISDVWGRFNSSIVAASQRYAADAIVTGRINKIGEIWQAKLSYINQDVESLIEFEAESEAALMAILSDQIAENLCYKYCVVQEVVSRMIQMQISGIGNFANFKKVEKYLSELSSIRKVEVDKIASTNVRFNVALLGDLQSVKDGVALGKYLVEEAAPDVDPFRVINVTQEIQQNNIVTEALDLQQNEATNQQPIATASQEGVLVTDNNGVPPALEEVILYYRWVE